MVVGMCPAYKTLSYLVRKAEGQLCKAQISALNRLYTRAKHVCKNMTLPITDEQDGACTEEELKTTMRSLRL